MKKIALLLVLALLVTVFVGCDKTDESGVSTDPIKIGVLLPTTGSFASLGEMAKVGCEIYESDIGNELAGRKIEVYYEDTASDTNTCIEKAQRLIEREGCTIIVGPLSGGEGMAIKEFAAGYPDVTFVVAGAASEDITMRGTYPNVFRTGYTGAQVTFNFGTFVYNELGIKKVVTCGIDNDFQYTQIAGFATSFILAGGEIVDRLWLPTDGNDYSSVLTAIPEEAEAVFLCAGAGQAVDFIKQFKEFGLDAKYQLIGGSTMTDSITLSSSAGQYLEGVYSAAHYSSSATHKEYVDFNEKYKARVGANASLFAMDYYTGLDAVGEAILALNGKVEDAQEFQKALAAVDFTSVRGGVKFDEYRNIIETVYINKVTDVDGVLTNVAQLVYEDQTQFGPFDPEWYQEQPAADRNNPTPETILGAKFAE